MRTLAGGRSESEGVVLSELAKAVLRARTGDGVIPQVIEEAHGEKSEETRCMRCILNDGEELKAK